MSLIIGYAREGFPSGLIDGVSIFIALTIISVVNSVNNYISERKLQDLVALSETQEVAVFRNSSLASTIDAKKLVVGDVYLVSEGMRIPADSILIAGQRILVDQSELTGEPEEQERVVVDELNHKTGAACTLLSRSMVKSGKGTALVVAVGRNSVAGIIQEQATKEDEDTPLQERLGDLAIMFGNLGFLFAGLTFVATVLRIGLELAGVIPCGCLNLFSCN